MSLRDIRGRNLEWAIGAKFVNRCHIYFRRYHGGRNVEWRIINDGIKIWNVGICVIEIYKYIFFLSLEYIIMLDIHCIFHFCAAKVHSLCCCVLHRKREHIKLEKKAWIDFEHKHVKYFKVLLFFKVQNFHHWKMERYGYIVWDSVPLHKGPD